MKNKRKVIVIVILVLLAVVLALIIAQSKDRITPAREPIQNKTSPVASSNEGSSTILVVEQAFSDLKDLNISTTSPDVGFPTGLSQYPALTWKNISIEEKSATSSMDVQYPKFIGGNIVAKLNTYISSFVLSIVADDRKELAQMIKDDPHNYNDDIQSISLNIGYNVIGVENGVVSLELVSTDYTGGGNGNHDTANTVMWDLKSNRALESKDIFCSSNYASVLRPILIKGLTDYFVAGNPDNAGFVEDWINGGVDGYDLLKQDGKLIVVYQPYTVSSGSSGIVAVSIPDSEIPHVVCLP